MTDDIIVTIQDDADIYVLVDDGASDIIYVPGLEFYKGADGKSVEMQKTATHIQWRLVGSDAWVNIVALADITGSNGKSAYQSYLDTTTDNPPMTEQAWSNQLGDINAALTALLAMEL